MKKRHKGKTSIVAKLREENASEAELKDLIGIYLQLEKVRPAIRASRKTKRQHQNIHETSLHRKLRSSIAAFCLERPVTHPLQSPNQIYQ
ncbi:MAG: hypothetical protein M2R45_00293 [Verrucomicrobia subdivision 3 bacterium]|nr:hypothetical protein [Limisphaerales bacterium]MCS1412947.1 hypothetical protein [Limisphaerales bacterium]